MGEVSNNIRIIQSNIEAQIENFERAPDTIFANTCFVCDNVREHVLNYEDEPHLSKTQNNHRRIFIASELFINFCGIYAHVVDYEYGRIIKEMLEWEKYKQLSKKITHRMKLELEREKHFIAEAQRKLFKSLEEARVEGIHETTPIIRDHADSETEVLARHDRETGSEQVQVTRDAIPGQEINETMTPPLESSYRTELLPNVTGNITAIRESLADLTQFELPAANISEQESILPNINAEISIRHPTVQHRDDEDDIDRLLRILEDEVLPKETFEIQQPEDLVEAANKSTQPEDLVEATNKSSPPEDLVEVVNKSPALEDIVTKKTPTVDVNDGEVFQTVASESSEGWSLPSLETVETIRTKRHYLIMDSETVIHDYAARAVQLNRNISIQRVQVFKGSPKMLQAISASNLMTTPAYKNDPFQHVRSSKLSKLYNRHLEVEKKPVEEILERRRITEPREIDISKVRTNTEIMEEVGMRAGMRSRPEKSDVLVEVQEKDRPTSLDITSVGVPPNESLIGLPVSRIINSTIEPPEERQMEIINSTSILPIPRVQQLQGKTLDPRTSPPWFLSTKENPPSAKYRKFHYVYDRLQMYWTILENQGMEKQITIREFLSFEPDGKLEDFLTVLRIVDKMSIQRILLLEYKSGDVVIRPFEIPYVSDLQISQSSHEFMKKVLDVVEEGDKLQNSFLSRTHLVVD